MTAKLGRVMASLAIGTATISTPAAGALPAGFRPQADSIIDSSWPADGPGAAIVVMEHGKIVYERGRGMADIEGAKPITPQTSFRIGSITKQFTASVIMQLVDEGKVSLDDPLSKFLPDYPLPGGTATVRQLLNHTSGIQPYTSVPNWMSEAYTARPHSTGELIAVFKGMPAVTPPGQAWAYNNSGYVLLGAIIETVTGKPWHEAVRERLSSRLGLKTMRFGVEEANAVNMAKGYTAGEKGPVLAQKIHMSVPHAAGGLIGSVEDLARWSNALHHGKVVTAASYAQMISPSRLPDGTSTPYGFGLIPGKIRGHAAIGHGGGIFGFVTDSLYIPDKDVFVAVFANAMPSQTQPDIVTKRLAAMAIGQPYPMFQAVKVDAAMLSPLAGIYLPKGKEHSETRVILRDGALHLQSNDRPEIQLEPVGEDRFVPGRNTLTWLQFRRDPKGVHVLEVHDPDSDPQVAVWSGPVPPEAPTPTIPQSMLESYVGHYKSDHFMMVIFFDGEGKLTARMEGKGQGRMRALTQTEFAIEGAPLKVTFEPGAAGVNRMIVHHGIEAVPANRVP